jgi:hypothetical protein
MKNMRVMLLAMACLFVLAATASADEYDGWKTYSMKARGVETIWSYRIKYPDGFVVDEGRQDQSDMKAHVTKFADKENASNSFKISFVEKGSSLSPEKGEAEVPFPGARNDVAFRKDGQMRFLTPDSRATIRVFGSGDVFEKALKSFEFTTNYFNPSKKKH